MPETGSTCTVYSDLVLYEVGRAGTTLNFMVPVLSMDTGSWLCQRGYCLSNSPPTELRASPLHQLGSGSEVRVGGPEAIQAPVLAPSHQWSRTLPITFRVAAEHHRAICESIMCISLEHIFSLALL